MYVDRSGIKKMPRSTDRILSGESETVPVKRHDKTGLLLQKTAKKK